MQVAFWGRMLWLNAQEAGGREPVMASSPGHSGAGPELRFSQFCLSMAGLGWSFGDLAPASVSRSQVHRLQSPELIFRLPTCVSRGDLGQATELPGPQFPCL